MDGPQPDRTCFRAFPVLNRSLGNGTGLIRIEHQTERRPRRRSGAAWAVAAILAMAQLAGAAHMLLVRHAVCPIDGELVHPGRAVGSEPAPALDLSRPGIASSTLAWADQDHPHCGVADHRRESAVLRAPVEQVRVPPPATLAPPLPTLGRRASLLPPYRLAPKQSPPV